MKEICKPLSMILKVLGKQKINNSVDYRKLTYVMCFQCDDGFLIYNLMTRQLVLLSDSEYADLKLNDTSNPLTNFLIAHWFLVPENNKDEKLLKQVDKIVNDIVNYTYNGYINNFIIYPTTDCNARCFYCFELKCKRINMTDKIAHDVVRFIEEKSGTRDITLNWFGGEPLFNVSAIDTICGELSSKNKKYISTMVSNAYLFNDDNIKKAVKLWHLTRIQVTLDGTEEVYNKVKSYIYKDDSSPFRRVLNNIEKLLQNGIYVSIRLNMSDHNYDDIGDLIDVICDRLNNYKNFNIYIALLYEDFSNRKTKLTDEQRKTIFARYFQLNKKLEEKGHSRKFRIEYFRNYIHCMADNNTYTTILPDGRLGKCEHYTDEYTYGTIYDDCNYDTSVIDKFKEVIDRGEQCYGCEAYPNCSELKCCPGTKKNCSDDDKKMIFDDIEDAVRFTYDCYLKGEMDNDKKHGVIFKE